MSTSTTTIHLPVNTLATNLMKRIQDNLENEGYEVSTSLDGISFRSINIRKDGHLVARCSFSVTDGNYHKVVWEDKITITWYVSSFISHPWLVSSVRRAVH